MRILLLSEPDSIHTVRWANALSQKGLQVFVYGFGSYKAEEYRKEVKVFSANFKHRGPLRKFLYVFSIGDVRKLIDDVKPHIVHSHYATSYGLLGKLARFKPFLISVWGSDIFEFPKISALHKHLLISNLAAATKVLSTSHIMALETAKYMRHGSHIEVTPFGIDLSLFLPAEKAARVDSDPEVVIGTVKALYRSYGIDILIKAFDAVVAKHNDPKLRLIIVGAGSEERDLRKLVRMLGREDSITFLGRRPHHEVPEILKSFDIFAALSVCEESFGVSVVEALACGIPVVVSNSGGLPEVVEDGVSGLVVPKGNVVKAADALSKLILNKKLRTEMGAAGRRRAERFYDWDKNVAQMVSIYQQICTNPDDD